MAFEASVKLSIYLGLIVTDGDFIYVMHVVNLNLTLEHADVFFWYNYVMQISYLCIASSSY